MSKREHVVIEHTCDRCGQTKTEKELAVFPQDSVIGGAKPFLCPTKEPKPIVEVCAPCLNALLGYKPPTVTQTVYQDRVVYRESSHRGGPSGRPFVIEGLVQSAPLASSPGWTLPPGPTG